MTRQLISATQRKTYNSNQIIRDYKDMNKERLMYGVHKMGFLQFIEIAIRNKKYNSKNMKIAKQKYLNFINTESKK